MKSITNLYVLILILLNIFGVAFMQTISEDVMEKRVQSIQDSIQSMQNNELENQKIVKEIQKNVLENQENIQETLRTVQETLKSVQAIQNSELENQKILQNIYQNLQHNVNESSSIVIQRRMDGSEDFDRTWNDYKYGFGNIDREFFIGLERLHELTTSERYELIITMENFKHERRYAKYDNFKIGSATEKYELKSVGNYNGTAGDSLTNQEGSQFTTKDEYNDIDVNRYCGKMDGGWWFRFCGNSNLNGNYSNDGDTECCTCIRWHLFNECYPLKFVEMELRKYSK